MKRSLASGVAVAVLFAVVVLTQLCGHLIGLIGPGEGKTRQIIFFYHDSGVVTGPDEPEPRIGGDLRAIVDYRYRVYRTGWWVKALVVESDSLRVDTRSLSEEAARAMREDVAAYLADHRGILGADTDSWHARVEAIKAGGAERTRVSAAGALLAAILLLEIMLLACSLVLWTAGTVRARRMSRRLSAGLCPFCGYPLARGRRRCPECGRAEP